MKMAYNFFNDFIITEIDLDNAEQKQAYYLLKTIECIYKLDQDIFTELKQLINTSKTLHKQIKLRLVPSGSLPTGANWNLFEKTINLELSTSTKDSDFEFIHGLIFELSNSVNQFFSSVTNLLLLTQASHGDPGFSGLLTELAEFETELLQYSVRAQITQNINNISSEQLNKILEFTSQEEKSLILSTLQLFGIPRIEVIYNTFEEYWESVTASDNNKGYRHTDKYEKICLGNSIEEEDSYEGPYTAILNKTYNEIVEQIQHGSFNITTAQKKYSNILTEAAKQSNLKKSEYYFLYQIIMQDGKRLEELDLGLTKTELTMFNQQIGFFFDISLVIEKVANGIINLNQISLNDKKFISLAFEIVGHCQQTESLTDARMMIAKKFMPKLQLIQNLNNVLLIDAHKNIIAAFNSILSENKQQIEFTPEVMDLIARADSIRSMWRHQTEIRIFNNKPSLLFSFNLTGGKLSIDNNGKATYSSRPRICFK